MALGPENERVEHYTFIHNVLAHFYRDSLDYFSSYLYPRFHWEVMGTYDKAVEYITKKTENGELETDKPNVPSIILNPNGDFNLDDANSGAKQFHRFPNLAPGMAKYMYNPIYLDSNIRITPSFTRIKGEMELILLCASVYEYYDLRLYMIQVFGGLERYIYPTKFNSFIIIPEAFKNFEYSNEYTGEQYNLDWLAAGATDNVLIETTNTNELVFPFVIKPKFKLMGLSDASAKYGGTDSLAEYKLSATVEYEVEIPSMLVTETDWNVEKINLEVGYGSAFSEYPEYASEAPINKEQSSFEWDSGMTSNPIDSDDKPELPTEADSIVREDYVLNTRRYYVFTADDEASEVNIIIDLPAAVDSIDNIVLLSKYGRLTPNDHYLLINSNTQIEIKIDNVDTIREGDFLEMYLYTLNVI